MIKYFFFIAGICVCFSVMGQTTFTSLKQVFDYADQHSVAIQASLMKEKMDIAKKEQAKSYLYPTVNAVAGYNDNIAIQPTLIPSELLNPSSPKGSYEEYKFGKRYVNTASVQTQWAIVDFQQMFAMKMATSQVQLSIASTAFTKFNTYKILASVYYAILITKESIKIYEDNFKTAKLISSNAEAKYQQGIISEDVLNRAKIQKIQADEAMMVAYNSSKQLMCQLQSALVMDECIVVDDNVENYLSQNLSQDLMTLHPEIKYQEAGLDLFKSQLRQVRALNYPTISMTYQYNYSWMSDKSMNFSDANKADAQFFGVKLSMPLFNGFYTKNKIKEVKWGLKQQTLVLEGTRIAKSKEDEILLLEYDQTQQSLEKSREVLSLQTVADKHIENKYQRGIISLDDRLDKYKELLNEQNSYLNSLGNYMAAEFQLYIRRLKL